MADTLLAPGFSTEPYWTDGLAPFEPPPARLGGAVDTAIIGGGYAGLSAALTLARGGQRVAVFEAATVGAGASSRSAGSLGHVPKASLGDLTRAYGEEVARRVYGEARQARQFVETLVRDHQIACGLRRSTRFMAAHSARAYAKFEGSLDALRGGYGEVELVPRGEQHRFIGSDAFFGGIALPNCATLQPALLHRGLAEAAVRAGAAVLQRTRVTGIAGGEGRFTVTSTAGEIAARHVVLATNAETGRETPTMRNLRRRIAVMPSYCLATEEIDPERILRILPGRGPVSDTYKILHYVAPNETGRRLIMSARAGQSDGSLAEKARLVFGYFEERFPDLRGVKVSHCWTGLFALSGDWVPHIGVEDGVHYVLGCCGTGVPMATYLGHKVAQKILGAGDAPTIFDRPLPKMPIWKRDPRVLPIAVRAYALRDRLFH